MKLTEMVRGFAPRRRLGAAARVVTLAVVLLSAGLAAAPRAEAHGGGGWDAVGGFVAGTFFGAALRPPVVVAPAYYPAPVYAAPAYAYYPPPRPVVVYGPRPCRHPHWYRRW